MLYRVLLPSNEIEDTQFTKSGFYSLWYGVLSNIVTGIFTYENMPKQLIRRLEQSFFYSSYVCSYEDKNLGIVVAPCTPFGSLNAWGEYSGYDLILPDGERKQLVLEESVIGYNYIIPTLCDNIICSIFAESLAELEISIRNAIILSRTTDMIEVPNDNALNEVQTQFNNYRIGVPLIVKRKRAEEEHKAFQLNPPSAIDEYFNAMRDILNEFLTITGLSSLVNPNKKERLIVDEISSNDDIKNTLLSNRINNRIDFIEEINAKFNTDFKVSIDDRIYQQVADISNFNMKEGEVDDE